jgi:hypothetical protein
MSTNDYGMTTERDPGADYCLQCQGSWTEAYKRERAARESAALQWQDEPDGEGWYWIEGCANPQLLTNHNRYDDTAFLTRNMKAWLAGRRVAKIQGPSKS